MANSRIEVVNNNVLSYVDSVFNEYTTHVTCPKDVESYKEWFTGAFLPCCITRWYEPSCYDIHNMFTIEQFFDNNIYIFSDILQILTDYFDDYNRSMDKVKKILITILHHLRQGLLILSEMMILMKKLKKMMMIQMKLHLFQH